MNAIDVISRRACAVVVLSAIAAAGSAVMADPSPVQILENVQKAYSSLSSLEVRGEAVASVTAGGRSRSSSRNYTTLFQRPAKLRHESVDGAARTMIVSDGKYVYLLPPGSKYYNRVPLKGGLRQLAQLGGPGLNPVSLLSGKDFAKNVIKPTIVGQARIDDVDTWIVQFFLDKKGLSSQKIWVGKNDWLVRKNELTSKFSMPQRTKNGAKQETLVQKDFGHVTSIKPNVEIKAGSFRFVAPKGVTEFDQKKVEAEMQKQMLTAGNALQGKKAPDFTLSDLSGHRVSLSSYKGKTVAVVFWSGMIPQCVQQMSVFSKIYRSERSKGFEVVAISMDRPETAKRSLGKLRLPFVVLTPNNQQEAMKVAQAYRLVGLPTTHILDKNGKDVAHFAGSCSESALREALRKAGLGRAQKVSGGVGSWTSTITPKH